MPHHTHAALWILGLVIVAASSIVVLLIAKAPEGHENENGFHRDANAQPAAKRETKSGMTPSAVGPETVKTA